MSREPVDLAKIKVGDDVTLLAKVACVTSDRIHIRLDDGSVSEVRFEAKDIASHTPKVLGVGDRVRLTPCQGIATVLAVRGDWLWLHENDSMGPYQARTDQVERAG